MGKAKDGSECYTRMNKSGGKYITCTGTQGGKSSSSPSKPKRPAIKVIKGKSKNIDLEATDTEPMTADGKMTIKQRNEVKERARKRRAKAANKFTTRPEGRIETGSLNPGIVVAEQPGVVGMTSTMSPLGQATFDALLGTGSDVAAGISAAIAERNKVGFYDIGFTGKIGSTNHFDIQEKYDTAEGSWFHRNMTLSGNLKKSQVDDIKREFPDVTISQPELPPELPSEDALSIAFGNYLTTGTLGSNEPEPEPEAGAALPPTAIRILKGPFEYPDYKGTEVIVDANNDKVYIERILKAIGWNSDDYKMISKAQEKRLINVKGRPDVYLTEDRGLGFSSTKLGITITQEEDSETNRPRTTLGVIRFKYIGNK